MFTAMSALSVTFIELIRSNRRCAAFTSIPMSLCRIHEIVIDIIVMVVVVIKWSFKMA